MFLMYFLTVFESYVLYAYPALWRNKERMNE